MQTKCKILSTLLLSILALVMLFSMSACGGDIIDEVLSLDPPQNLKYSGSAVTWDTVEGAAKYVVKVNDGTEIPVTSTSFSYSSKVDFTISVKASTESGKVMSEATVATFKYLGAVDSLELTEEGAVTWLPVDGATSYLIKLNGEEISVGNATSYSDFGVGLNSISVRPVVDGDSSYFSPWCSAINVTVLGTVDAEKIAYDGEYITFPSVTSAKGYNIYINGEILEENTTSKKIAYDAGNSDFSVTIQALGNPQQKILNGAESEAKEFIYLDNVTGVRIENGVLKWDAVEKADGYQLKIGNNIVAKNLTKTQYDDGRYLVAGRNLEISLKPISSDKACFSSFSTPVSIFLLEAPVLQWNTDLSLDGGEYSIFWNEVQGAIGYEISVTDPTNHVTTYTYGASEAHFAHDYEMVGTYTVTARALANEASDSIYSSLLSKEVVVIRPENPKKSGSGFIVSNPTDLSAGFTVTCEHNSKATSYQLYKNDLLIATSTRPQFVVSNLVNEDVIDGQEDLYSIKLIGGVRTVGGKITATLNSLGTLEFPITILATPQNVMMEGYTVKYESVVDANNGYAITGAGSAAAVTEMTTSRDLSSDLQAGNYNLQVCAKGNGSDVLASNYSPIIRVHRLAAPYDIKIDTALSGNGVLTYSVENGTRSIELWIDNQKINSIDNVIDNMNDYVKTSGTYVKLVAVCNDYGQDGVYYMSSMASNTKQFIKLEAPSNLTFDNTHLKWNMEGINTAQIAGLTFQIFNESNVLAAASQSDRSYDISHLEGGRTYTFTVVARGNGETYINSDPSAPAEIYKLDTPIVRTEGNNYVWDSVSDATSYAVTVDGVIYDTDYHQSGSQFIFNPASAFDRVKTYTLTFTAIGDGGIDTINSAPLVIEQEVDIMAKPDFRISYSSDVYDPQAKIMVDITSPSPFATGYRYTIFNGETKELTGANSTHFEHIAATPGEYKFYVYALGETFDDNGVYLIDSEARGGDAYTIYLLGTINKTSMKLSGDGRLTFDTIDKADGYGIKVVLTTANGTFTYETTETTSAFDISKAISQGKIAGISNYKEVTSVHAEVYARAVLPNKVQGITQSQDWTGNLHP